MSVQIKSSRVGSLSRRINSIESLIYTTMQMILSSTLKRTLRTRIEPFI